jgi:superfamily II DNA or RNA helicase
MSFRILIDELSEEQKEKIANELTIKPEPVKKGKSYFTPKTQAIEIFSVEGEHVIIPFSFAIKLGFKKPKATIYNKINIPFSGSLRSMQKEIKDEAITNLNTYGATLISCYPGFGKTILSIYIASKIGLQTIIIVNRVVLMKQWKEAIENFCGANAKVFICDSKKQYVPNCDFYICNAINVKKIEEECLKTIGTVIVDEAHLIMSSVLSQSLRFLFPKYLIGLSATPYRTDGFNILLDHYFTENKIIRKMHQPHLVYKINTTFTPEIEYDRNGNLNWGKIIEAQSLNEDRNNLIIKIIQQFKDRTFLILTKRVEGANILLEKLKIINESVDTFIESKTEFDRHCRILIGTTSKVGVGFDHDKLDALILASDLEEYFIQYLGRVFRRHDTTPVVFDLVDNNPILKRHFATRKSTYMEAGGTISTFTLDK